MLKDRRVISFFVLCAICAIWILWWASSGFPSDGQICEIPEPPTNCGSYNVFFYSAYRLAAIASEWSALIAAFATGFIAWFTWTLRQSTEKMWGETKKAAEAVTIVERAYVYPVIVATGAIEQCIIAGLDSEEDDVPAPMTAELVFKFKNFGKTPAILKSAYVAFGVPPHGALIGIAIPESVLASLEETGSLVSQMQIGVTRKQAQHIRVYTGHISFEGNVTFDDIWGNEHTTEFYFVWDKEIDRMALRGIKTETKAKQEG